MKLSEAIDILSHAGVDSPRHDAIELFVRFGGFNRTELVRDVESDNKGLQNAVVRRSNREPLQYIIGEVGFYRETYTVSSDCLIPRSDTEILVDYAVRHIPCGEKFLDLCTGSGCVAVSTLKNTEDTSAAAVDISEAAISLAKENAKKNGVSDRCEFICADALSGAVDGEFFAVLSNPPYVSEAEYESLSPEIYFEPKIAFVGGTLGLDFYGRILDLYRDSLREGGFFAFEIGYNQGDAIMSLAKERNMSCEILKDYSHNDRVAVIAEESRTNKSCDDKF